tara:strand:- start:607 stop:1218 length:612 start_codon:yes stop_codon:yes gene_type:complete
MRKTIKKGDVTVEKVYNSNFQAEGTKTAQLHQTVVLTTYYPTTTFQTSTQDNVFKENDFNFKSNIYEKTEKRYAWLVVPEDVNKAEVQKLINAEINKFIYKTLSSRPILNDIQERAIVDIDKDIDLNFYANKQAVRYSDKHEETPGELIFDVNGKIQYMVYNFSTKITKDLDLRTDDPTDFYVSYELEAEINQVEHIPKGQDV